MSDQTSAAPAPEQAQSSPEQAPRKSTGSDQTMTEPLGAASMPSQHLQPSLGAGRYNELPQVAESDKLEKFLTGDVFELTNQISFDGMDPRHIRDLTNVAFKGDSKSIVKAITMYIHWGSKFYNRATTSKDSAKATEAIANLKKLGIHEDKRNGKLTLARVAAAHAPLLIAVRYMLYQREMLPPPSFQPKGLHPAFCDLGLACYSEDPTIGPMIMEFLRAFALELQDHAVRTRRSGNRPVEEVLADMNKYRRAAVASLTTDGANRVNPKQATDINAVLIHYGYKPI